MRCWPRRCRRSACIWRTAASASSRTADRVRATFENGVEIEADVLIAADGIFSAVRRVLLGPERPRFACRAYRGLIPAEKSARHSAGVDGVARPGPALHPLFRLGRPDVEFRRPRRAGGLDQRILDRAGQRRRPARGLCGLASAGAAHHRRGRRDLHLGGARPPADRALDLRPRHHAGRRLPSDDPVHGPGRRAGDRGRRRDHRVPASNAATTSRPRSSSTKPSVCRAPRRSRMARGRTRPGSTCPTAPPRRRGMPRWPRA